MSKLKRNLLLLLVFLASSWSLLRPGFFRVHDYTHASRIAEMTLALEDGHFPVRWTKNFGFGFGMPLFQFYAPLPFYVGSLFYYLGLDIVLSIKLLYFISNLASILGVYYLIKELFSQKDTKKPTQNQLWIEQVAILSSAVFALAPYRAVNLFVRGALSEAWGIMAFPWILLGVVLLVKHKKNAGKILLSSLAVLFLSHNLMTMIFMPVVLAFFLFMLLVEFACDDELLAKKKFKFTETVASWLKNFRHNRRQLVLIIKRFCFLLLLAIGVTSFYLIPAFLEKDLTQMTERIAKAGAYFDFHWHFIYLRQLLRVNWGYGGSEWGPDDGISFFFGFGQWAVIFLALLSIIVFVKKQLLATQFKIGCFKVVAETKKTGKIQAHSLLSFQLTIFALMVLLVSVLFATFKTIVIWENISLFTYIQFPWRFLSISILAIAMLSPIALALLRNQKLTNFLFFALLLATLANSVFFRPEFYLDNASDFYYTDQQKIREQMSDILPDYIPQSMPLEIEPANSLVLNQNLDSNDYEILLDSTHQKLIKTNFKHPVVLSLAIANYPGWQVEINGQKNEFDQSKMGNIEVMVPADEQLLGVYFANTPVRFYADLISIISLLIIIYLLVEIKNLPNKLAK